MDERTVLITGATGAVGGAVVDAMLEAGWHVVATWVVPEERERMGEREGLELVQADLLHEHEVARRRRRGRPSARAGCGRS